MAYSDPLEQEGIDTIRKAVLLYGTNLEAYKTLGSIKVVQYDDLLLFNYTALCPYERRWNAVERVSRGLIIDLSGNIIARPFPKFFNIGEMEETKFKNLPETAFEVSDKMDGSLGILYWYGDEPRIATRGSFTSEQAVWATAFLQEECYDLRDLRRGFTYLFEIIYPENRIVVNYGDHKGLCLIGIKAIHTGEDLSSDVFLREVAHKHGFDYLRFKHEVKSLRDLYEYAKQCSDQNCEGWVVKFANNLRVKFKTDEYMRLHRIVTKMTPQLILEAMIDGSYQSVIANIPDEFYAEADSYYETIMRYVHFKKIKVYLAYHALYHSGITRKEFAKGVMTQFLEDSIYLFALYDEYLTEDFILKNIDVKKIFQGAR